MKYLTFAILIIINIISFKPTQAQELFVDYQGTFKAKIIKISEGRQENVGFSDVLVKYQNLEVKLLNGPLKNQVIAFESDFPNIKKDQKIYINYNIHLGKDVSTEIIRAIVGSISLIMTVPIVTFLAVFYLKNYEHKNDRKGCGHSHAHHGHIH